LVEKPFSLARGFKKDAIKSLAQFEFQKVPKMLKYAKDVFPILQSYNQNKGVDGKSS
jgi:hypothetical protein